MPSAFPMNMNCFKFIPFDFSRLCSQAEQSNDRFGSFEQENKTRTQKSELSISSWIT